MQRDLSARAVAHGVVDQVLNRTRHGHRAQLQRHLAIGHHTQLHRFPGAFGLGHNVADQGCQIGALHLFNRIGTGEIEEGFDQALHLVDIADQRAGLGAVLLHRQAQLQPRQRRAQIMTDTREHHRALLDLALDPGAHIEKRGACRADLGRARRMIAAGFALPECFRRARQPADRAELIAQENISDQRHQNCRQNHQDQQLMRVGGRHAAARESDIQNALLGLKRHRDRFAIVDEIYAKHVKFSPQRVAHHAARQIVKPAPVFNDAARPDGLHRQSVAHLRQSGGNLIRAPRIFNRIDQQLHLDRDVAGHL